MSSIMGILVTFVFFGIYGWFEERKSLRARRRERAITSPHRAAEVTVVRHPDL